MQTLPATATLAPSPDPLTGIPTWTIDLVGFVLIGIAAALIVSSLRAAFPPTENPTAKKLHYFYPFIVGAMLAEALPVALPGWDYTSRWFIGLLAPFLGVYVYNYYKEREEKRLGVKLPSVGDMVGTTGGAVVPPVSGGKP